MISCVFAREFWFKLLESVQLQELAPQSDAISFMGWWWKTNERPSGLIKKGFNSLFILGAWTLWKHQNRCVFYGIAPTMAAAMTQAVEERKMWKLAGARGITYLMAQIPDA
jgi:hypothetical protein